MYATPNAPPVDERLRWAYLATLVGGILNLVSAAFVLMVAIALTAASTFVPETPPQFPAFVAAIASIIILASAAIGIAAIVLARRMKDPGTDLNQNGIITLIVGGVAMLTGGGMFIGAVGILGGGALMMMVAQARKEQEQRGTQ